MEEAQGLFADCLQELVDKLGKWPSAKQFAEETGLETDEAKEVLKQCKPLVTGPPKRAKKDHNKVAAENADKTPAMRPAHQLPVPLPVLLPAHLLRKSKRRCQLMVLLLTPRLLRRSMRRTPMTSPWLTHLAS